MSGGVDSSVAAYILKEQGYEVIGATMRTWGNGLCRDTRAKGCCTLADIDDARSVAGKLKIPYYVMDLSGHFKEDVIDYFTRTYLEGRTPNPCIQCNNKIKFGVFLDKAKSLQADFVATGHYARRAWHAGHERWVIREAQDLSKDQSYVLFGLTQEQIEKTLFPVGPFTKAEIRRIAQTLGLRVHDKPDSQEICFVSSHYGEFMAQQGITLPGEGDIIDTEGRVLGRHPGYHLFTTGQRKGLHLKVNSPHYVIRVDKEGNEVVVGREEDLYSDTVRVKDTRWALPPRLDHYDIKIRSRNRKSPGRIIAFSEKEALFAFDQPERAVAPGQAGVFYQEDMVAGGGWIDEAL